ncbi:hypothetical protein SAMN05421736_105158 [Evansella caseinilytica]|uniref:Uncharacterized protein n=1 Tax=Evansella caseinilytica TaxID=1503961 RepID=A0A1H3PQN4_9BACI|nr:hypothetical protein [Evansella caseinilytica]SDZ03377.1 hypothetical protein SAMN05421736_105158 [Evansella caseinilytica]
MNYYNLCCQHKGQLVRITETCGKIHVGKIAHVDPKYVWLERGDRGGGSFGYGYPYGGYVPPAGYAAPGPYGAAPVYGRNPYFFPVALAGIGGFALGTAFFW